MHKQAHGGPRLRSGGGMQCRLAGSRIAIVDRETLFDESDQRGALAMPGGVEPVAAKPQLCPLAGAGESFVDRLLPARYRGAHRRPRIACLSPSSRRARRASRAGATRSRAAFDPRARGTRPDDRRSVSAVKTGAATTRSPEYENVLLRLLQDRARAFQVLRGWCSQARSDNRGAKGPAAQPWTSACKSCLPPA